MSVINRNAVEIMFMADVYLLLSPALRHETKLSKAINTDVELRFPHA